MHTLYYCFVACMKSHIINFNFYYNFKFAIDEYKISVTNNVLPLYVAVIWLDFKLLDTDSV